MTDTNTTPRAPRTFSFIFDPSKLVSVPAEAFEAPKRNTAPNANPLPFKAFFDAAAPAINEALATNQLVAPPLFVSFSYFVEDRKAEAAKVDGAYVTSKVRDQFNEWRDATKVVTVPEERAPSTKKLDANGNVMLGPKTKRPINIPGKVITAEVSTNPERGKFALTAITRNGTEIDPTTGEAFGEPGVSFWMILGEEERTAVLEAQKAELEAKTKAGKASK